MNDELVDFDDRQAPRTLTMRDLTAVLFRQKRLLFVSFAVIFLLVVLWGAMKPAYKAEMKILVQRERVDPVVTSQANVSMQVAQQEITESELNSEVELLKSQDLLQKVVVANRLQQAEPSWRSLLGTSSPAVWTAHGVRRLAQGLKVEPLPKSNMISVSFESSNPELADRVLKSVADLYLEKHLHVHRPSGEFGFFNKETEQLRRDLSGAQNRLTEFTREKGVVSAQLERDLTLQKASELEASLTQMQAAIEETEQRIRTLEQEEVSIPPRLTSQLRTSDNPTLLQQMKSSLLALELKRTEMLSKFEPTYRPVVELEKQISETRAAISAEKDAPVRDETTDRNPVYEWVKSEMAKAQTDLTGLKARAGATKASLARYRDSARALQQASVVQQDLQRTVKTEEDNYLLYQRKEEEARINDALDRGRILNVAIAEPPTLPVLPTRSFRYYALLGIFLAVAGSIGLAFISDLLDSSFRTPDEVSSFLNSPVLASIPKSGR